MSKTIHVHLSVRGALRMESDDFQKLSRSAFDEQGRPLAPVLLRERLFDLLAEGVECIPIGKACDGFSYKTGCPGHETETTK